MAYNSTIPTKYWDGDEIVAHNVSTPQIFRGQAELYNALMANGIEVYVITAAAEELVPRTPSTATTSSPRMSSA
jgi:hypothetical protein